MNLSGNTVLITGGGTGIGFSLARLLVKEGSTVLICGRRMERLLEAQKACPELKIKVSDISNADDRKALADWAIAQGVNILVNNAGMQRMIDLKRGVEALEGGDNEIRCNFEGPVYLTAQLIGHLMSVPNAAIYNVTSALGYVPIAFMPIYCATKAAIHSYTMSLRHQLAPSGVRVVEIIPPTVDTDLDRGARATRGQTDRGISAAEAAESIMKGMKDESPEIAIGMAANLSQAPPAVAKEIFARMNGGR